MSELQDAIYAMNTINIVVLTVCLLGTIFLANWLFNFTHTFTLAGCPIRRNSLPLYLPLVGVVAWLLVTSVLSEIMQKVFINSPDWLFETITYLGMSIIEIVMIAIFLYFSFHNFARRLKGLGFNFKTIPTDLFWATVNFIAIVPATLIGLQLVYFFGVLIFGPEFEMQTNQGLVVLTEYDNLTLRLLMLVFVIVVAPLFEEILFRGLLQSMFTNLCSGPWRGIVITSILFAMLHPPMHWPALFVLSMAMGYAYEKSGSLFRPFFIHAIFNASSVTIALLSQSQ